MHLCADTISCFARGMQLSENDVTNAILIIRLGTQHNL